MGVAAGQLQKGIPKLKGYTVPPSSLMYVCRRPSSETVLLCLAAGQLGRKIARASLV